MSQTVAGLAKRSATQAWNGLHLRAAYGSRKSGPTGSIGLEMTETIVEGLAAVMTRYRSFQRHGALIGEGGERAFRGWLAAGFLYEPLGWPWRHVVFGESMDLLLLNWQDHPVIYIETKSPTDSLRLQHRREMEGRLHRWGSLTHLFLTNGKAWERFDRVGVPLGEPDDQYVIEDEELGASEFFAPLAARRYLRLQ